MFPSDSGMMCSLFREAPESALQNRQRLLWVWIACRIISQLPKHVAINIAPLRTKRSRQLVCVSR